MGGRMGEHEGMTPSSGDRRENRTGHAGSATEADGCCIFNLPELLARIGGNEQIAERLVQTFCVYAEDALPALERAVAERDAEKARRILHSLKGASGSIAADRIYRLTIDLHTAAGQGDLEALADAVGSLQKEYDAFKKVAAGASDGRKTSL